MPHGHERVGGRYEEGTYFISALIMAGEIMREITELADPASHERRVEPSAAGKMVMGTVAATSTTSARTS